MARPRTFDEALVVRQAREVFHEHGYAATSVEHLTAATGLSRSSLYGAFGDKRGLFLRAFALYCADHGASVEQQLVGDERGARSRLERHLRSMAAVPEEPHTACLLAKATAECAAEDAEVARTATEFYAAYERALTACVRDAQAAGDVRSDLDPAAAGALLLSVLRGLEALGSAGHPGASLESVVDAAMAGLTTPR